VVDRRQSVKLLNCLTSNAVSIYISISLTKLTVVDVSARYLIQWEQDGLGVSPGVEEECVYMFVACYPQ